MITNALTVDLEDWFQGLTSTNPQRERWDRFEARLEANTKRVLQLFDQCKTRATFFVLGYVADHYPDLVRRIDAEGHEIGVHGYWHTRVDRQTPQSFGDELDRALEALSPLVSQPIVGHRAPYFSINQGALWAIDVLCAKGFRYDSSFFPTRNMLYGYPQSPRLPHRLGGSNGLMEFPVATARYLGTNWPIGGGFYVRALPVDVVAWAIQRLNRQSHPAVIYLHPWELDTAQRYSPVTLRERITHYYGRRGLEAKLKRLLGRFQFTTVRNVLTTQYGESQ